MRHNLARGGPVETTKDPASMVDRWRRSSRPESPSTAQNLSASLVSGARCWGTSYRRHRRGLLLGTISIARCRLSIKTWWRHAVLKADPADHARMVERGEEIQRRAELGEPIGGIAWDDAFEARLRDRIATGE